MSHTRTESGTDTASRITPEEAARELTADHNFDYQDSTAASTSNQHLPECIAGQSENGTVRMYVGDDPTPYTGVCICNRLRACEQRALITARELLTDELSGLPIKWTSDELFPAVLTIHRVFESFGIPPQGAGHS